MTEERPIFIPLRREYFEAFERGEKTEEYRRHEGRWTAQHCRIGRKVTLSLGYGTKRRLTGTVSSYRLEFDPVTNIPAWHGIYGQARVAACIGIKLDTVQINRV